MRDKIEEKLKEWEEKHVEENKRNRIYYGQKARAIEIDDWNYIVFGLEEINKSGTNSQDLSGYYFVDIIRENFIDDETIFSLIETMEEIAGIKLCKGSNPIDYITKGNTSIVCEMMRLRFTRPMKRSSIGGGN